MIEQFKQDVDEGLSREAKSLPSKYFYNKRGDALFVNIMHAPEYYLTRSELEIFQLKTPEIINILDINPESYFELIELGAGDGLKTMKLLQAFQERAYDFDYFPIDISINALEQLEQKINKETPSISVKIKQGDYFQVLHSLKETPHPILVLFLGSNIGNMNDELASDFMEKLSNSLEPNDKLLLGVDLIKPSSIVLPAYNDKQGYTREFNLNLLKRINDELEGDFNLDAFAHKPEYSEESGEARSYLMSLAEQKVTIGAINKSYHFSIGEKIFTEISRKYNDTIIEKMIEKSDFEIIGKLSDEKGYFANYIFTKK